MAAPFEAHYAGSDYCAALVGRVAVIIGRDRPGPRLPEHGSALTKRLAADHPDGCGFMIVLRSEAPPPNDDTRARVAGFFDGCSQNALAGAIVIEGKGFVAASIRSFFAAYSLVAYRFKLKVYSSVREAAPELLRRLGRSSAEEGGDLVAGIEALKTAYAADALDVVAPASATFGTR